MNKNSSINRININEKRLDDISICVTNLQKSLKKFKFYKKELTLLNRYYGSPNWFKDKDYYESAKAIFDELWESSLPITI